MCSYGVKVLVMYSIVLIFSSALSSTKPGLDPIADVIVFELENTSNCSLIFEGYICGDDNNKNCPSYVIGSDAGFNKHCETRVRRFRLHEDENDFFQCNPAKKQEDVEFRRAINITNVVGSSISAITLILSMLIFTCLESWHNTRISIDVNLFVAFLLNNCCCIALYYFVISDPDVIKKNEIWCRVLNVVSNYFMLSSYTWMLCESFHLHLALCVVFIHESIPFRLFAVLGWGVPAVITGFYTASRTYLERTERCWIDKGNSTWILVVPILISLLASFVYLVINVVRILINKLHHSQSVQSSFTTRRTARAALLLIPLFGIHFALIPFRPIPNTTAEKVYEIFLTLLTSLQGVCISMFLCFTNREVVAVLQTGVNRIREALDMIVEPNPNSVMDAAPGFELA